MSSSCARTGQRERRTRRESLVCTPAELLVVMLVFGLMWTCGGLAMQARLRDLRGAHAAVPSVVEVEVVTFGGQHVALPRGDRSGRALWIAPPAPPPEAVEGADLGSVPHTECSR